MNNLVTVTIIESNFWAKIFILFLPRQHSCIWNCKDRPSLGYC